MSSDFWQKEYGVVFYEDTNLAKLRKLAYQYHEETEDFDQLICLHKRENGIAQPSSGWEMQRSTQNARETFNRLFEEAVTLGFSEKEFRDQIRVVSKDFEYHYARKRNKTQ